MSTTNAIRHAYQIIAATVAYQEASEHVCAAAFTVSADQVARARALVRDHLINHPAGDTAVLLVSELATNAVCHSRSSFFALTIARTTTDRVRITVIDEGRNGIPYLRNATADTEDGRGMAIVDLLATRWGITRLPAVGTAVWFECAGE
ncbi:ATP-binding protein [Actinoallomurus iriomotensis]|uniref:Histidine kinase/HSP90-like ATPase domain-containing protein n=1 Tax=Actinoallomurus iriomotensis TaxID=478107 RepID=A0A9W6S2H9_9ACTN|nr:ATP-binding protein [Actinoallomurus iriomotensis]GLY86028.1 hypothetical protein Airi02_039570 [Actinoallomurus iriomotensis]